MNFENRTLFIADNLDITRGMDAETIDLIYLDPPFNTKKNYKAPIGSPAEGASFKDIWTDDDIKFEWHGEIAEQNEELYQIIQAASTVYDASMKIYLTAMAVRLFEMHRLLKPTGSVYLHCDPTASHYIKLVMDSLFGKQNFRNEVVWHYRRWTGTAHRFLAMHDTLLFYTKEELGYVFNPLYTAYTEKSLKRKQNHHTRIKGDDVYVTSINKKGVKENDVWVIPVINPNASERTGYPTQNPLALLERIIKASSNEGDMVLDPFCGCATACVAAENLDRQWIGIDISPSAEDITKLRLSEEVDKGADLWNPFQDVSVLTTPPIRTDPPTPTRQMHLPAAHTHKHALFGQQEGKCNGCLLMFPFRNMTIDHIMAQSKGGSDHIENLQLLCNACNSTKSTRSQEEFIEILIERGIRT